MDIVPLTYNENMIIIPISKQCALILYMRLIDCEYSVIIVLPHKYSQYREELQQGLPVRLINDIASSLTKSNMLIHCSQNLQQQALYRPSESAFLRGLRVSNIISIHPIKPVINEPAITLPTCLQSSNLKGANNPYGFAQHQFTVWSEMQKLNANLRKLKPQIV